MVRTALTLVPLVTSLGMVQCSRSDAPSASVAAPASASATVSAPATATASAPATATASGPTVATASGPATATASASATATVTATAPATAHALATASPATSAKSAPTCGYKPLPPCPLYAWMKANTAPALSAQDFGALVTAFDKIAGFAPPAYTHWQSIARDGADAARVEQIDAVKAACRGCHNQYKDRYKKELRDRPI